MRRPLIAGNWKMNKTVAEARAFAREFRATPIPENIDVVVAAPFTALAALGEALAGSFVAIAAQTMHEAPSGAFTGEISAPMLRELGVTYVIIGHSERRAYDGENDDAVNRKVRSAIAHGLTPIVAVGETRVEYEDGLTVAKVTNQTRIAFANVSFEDVARCVVAYEPIWAIGTGLGDTPESANRVIGEIRACVPGLAAARLLYGGSVRAENAAALMAQSDIDGGLIGGASLEPASFAAIVACARARRGMSARARTPLVLAILDGWGYSADTYGNAIANADLPNWKRILATYPHALLAASGEAVGLPEGVMGNSEVGHINIGSGRVVPQGVVVINGALADGSFATNATLQAAIAHASHSGGRLHLMGLLSDGRVHSSIDHLFALLDAAAPRVPLAIHVFGDGRDVPPSSLERYLGALEGYLARVGATGAIATLSGRFYAMDRDKRWERVERAYQALAQARSSFTAPTAAAALAAAYARGETDEFIVPTIVGEARPVRSGDAVVFFNFRPDRARELTLAFTQPGFKEFAVTGYERLYFATMTKYEEDMANPVLFGPRPQSDTFGEVVAAAGLSQLRLAETEKYAHVTYFFNGGRETVFAGEDRVLVPSDRSVQTYDLAPEMRAAELTTAAVEDLGERLHDVIVMNYANADMVGHTGVMSATISSVETLDVALGRLERAVLEAGGLLAITADHGNAEEKLDEAGRALTAHTTNPVPFVLVSREPPGTLEDGELGDVATTLLPLLELDVPAAMTGRNLLVPAAVPARAT